MRASTYLTLAMLFICGLTAFGPAQTVKQEPTERLERRYWGLNDDFNMCGYNVPCLDTVIEKQNILYLEIGERYIRAELGRRDREKVQATTQALEGKRKP